MARQARIVVEDTAHHISQRGNRGEPVFFEKADYQTYLDILVEQCHRFDVAILCYCLLPNQVHLIIEPQDGELMARAVGEAHRRYTCHINERNDWRGHLFQDRFFSYAMDERSTLRAARFIERLPVTLKIAPKPENYLWSSAKARIKIVQNSFLKPFEAYHMTHNWEEFLARPMDPKEMDDIQLHLQTGRPRGSDLFLDTIEEQIGRTVRPQKRGRKPKKDKKSKAA